MPKPFIAHIDADCYYVSAERVRHPHMVGAPVGVIGNQGACVIAKSYEAKKAGIKTGEPIWEAVAKCPDLVSVKRDFAWYEVLSRKMLTATETLSPCVEFYSIDEFFAVVPDAETEAQALDFAVAVRDRIRDRVGVPVTVGVGRTRTLAKLFSDTAKPNGSTAIIAREREEGYMARMPVTEITGIGGRRALRLETRGVRTCLEFARANRLMVRDILTIVGEQLWWECNGTPVLPVRPGRPHHKMIGRGGSLAGRVSDPQILFAWVVHNLHRLVEALEFYEVQAGKLELFLSHKDAPSTVASVPLDSATNRFEDLLEYCQILLRRTWRKGWQVTHMQIISSDLRLPGFGQRSLFDEAGEQKEQLAELRRKVNTRHGRWTLRSGATLFLPQLFRDRSNTTEVCDIHGKFCF